MLVFKINGKVKGGSIISANVHNTQKNIANAKLEASPVKPIPNASNIEPINQPKESVILSHKCPTGI